MGMAKPKPSTEAEEELALEEYFGRDNADDLPWLLNRGPPELPELMAQSVWIIFILLPSLMVMVRSRAEMMPVVSREGQLSQGVADGDLPPTSMSLELPMTTGVSASGLHLDDSNVVGLAAHIGGGILLPSEKVTLMELAPSMTW